MKLPYFCSKASTFLFRLIRLPNNNLVKKRSICFFTSKQPSILNIPNRFYAISVPKKSETTKLYRRKLNVQPSREHISGTFYAYIAQGNRTGEIIFQLYKNKTHGCLWLSLEGLKKFIECLGKVHETVLENEAHVLEFRRNDGDVLYEEKFVDEGRNRLITLKLVVNYGKHRSRQPAGEISLLIETENLKESLKYSFINLAILPGSNVILNLKNNLEEELLKAYEEKRWETQVHKEHNHPE